MTFLQGYQKEFGELSAAAEKQLQDPEVRLHYEPWLPLREWYEEMQTFLQRKVVP